uniref:RING-type domain-containing protein n=1 Tax=Romanomermis culicivorax TaxID=13658 RepID=A0A915HMS9_ROMCU
EKTLDPDVKKLLIDAKATLYLPILAQKRVTINLLTENLDDDSFFERIGIHDQVLIKNLRHLLTHGSGLTSAMPEKPAASSLPTVKAHFEMECVICMERKSSTIFLPCGHVCCCHFCDENVQICPLCRSRIDQKIDLSCEYLNFSKLPKKLKILKFFVRKIDILLLKFENLGEID